MTTLIRSGSTKTLLGRGYDFVYQEQAQELIREIEKLCRNHGVWYTKTIEYKEKTTVIKLTDISVKIDKQEPR